MVGQAVRGRAGAGAATNGGLFSDEGMTRHCVLTVKMKTVSTAVCTSVWRGSEGEAQARHTIDPVSGERGREITGAPVGTYTLVVRRS